MKNPASKGGADQLGGDHLPYINNRNPRPLLDSLASYRALTLMADFGIRPELAAMVASLAFGGGR